MMAWQKDEAAQIGRIETKIDTLIETVGDHEERIRGGERFRNRAYGAGAVLAGILSFVGYIFHGER